MWTCKHCGEEVEDNFGRCWNCQADTEGDPPEEALAPLAAVAEENRAAFVRRRSSLKCLRCDDFLVYQGGKQFHEGINWGVLGALGELFVTSESFEMYSCPRCGHVEFFLPGTAG